MSSCLVMPNNILIYKKYLIECISQGTISQTAVFPNRKLGSCIPEVDRQKVDRKNWVGYMLIKSFLE